MTRRGWMAIAIIMVVGLALGVAGATKAQQADAAPQQTLECTWSNIGNSSKQIFHTASAYDTDNNKMYVYSGVDNQYAPTNAAEVGDLSGTTFKATWKSVASSQASKRVGATGAFRAKGADSDMSGAYFFGGMTDTEKGVGTSIVEAYMTKAGKWEDVDGTDFDGRSFAAAAYDPDNDVIWVVGGIAKCALPDVIGGASCAAKAIPTQYLSWDATTGAATWNELPNGNQSYYAHSMVYDAARKRMVIYGGTANIKTGRDDVIVLDTSGGAAAATFSSLSTTGTAPSSYFGGAVAFASQDWLVTYGGVKQAFMASNESTETRTYALDLTKTPAEWNNLSPKGSPGPRVGGTMQYAANHMGAVFALGRDKSDGDIGTIEKIQRTSYGLKCEEVVTPSATTPPPTTTTPTPDPSVTVSATTPAVTQPPKPGLNVCSYVPTRVPASVISHALANPEQYAGYEMRCNPNVPLSPWNIERSTLGLQNPKALFHPLFNTVVWKCGCP